MEGLLPSGITSGRPSTLEAGVRAIPVSPVTPFSWSEAAVSSGMMSTFAPVGTVKAVNAEPVSEIFCGLPIAAVDGGDHRLRG
jgi:hypothetical protein